MHQKNNTVSAYIHLLNQKNSIRTYYPEFKTEIVKNELIIKGELQPSPLHKKYKFRLSYIYKKSPIVDIIEPKIQRREPHRPVPHVYEKNRPCLYYPKTHEFTHDMMLSETIIPWLSLWLYFYEVWYTTGVWLGEGVHNNEKKNS